MDDDSLREYLEQLDALPASRDDYQRLKIENDTLIDKVEKLKKEKDECKKIMEEVETLRKEVKILREREKQYAECFDRSLLLMREINSVNDKLNPDFSPTTKMSSETLFEDEEED